MSTRSQTLDPAALGADPIAALRLWCEEARDCGMREPSGMNLATIAEDGGPDARIVLLKGIDDDGGMVFFTNYESAKGCQLTRDPRAALVLWWDPLGRQVRIRGAVERMDTARSDIYHAARQRGSQLSAWASSQSRPVKDRPSLEAAFAAQEARFGDGEVPRPEYWGGFRLIPFSIEFWQHQDDRLHDRVVYTRDGDAWKVGRIQP